MLPFPAFQAEMWCSSCSWRTLSHPSKPTLKCHSSCGSFSDSLNPLLWQNESLPSHCYHPCQGPLVSRASSKEGLSENVCHPSWDQGSIGPPGTWRGWGGAQGIKTASLSFPSFHRGLIQGLVSSLSPDCPHLSFGMQLEIHPVTYGFLVGLK